MLTVPTTLEVAIIQAQGARRLAFKNQIGYIAVELAILEIALQVQSLDLKLVSIFENLSGLKIIFPDIKSCGLSPSRLGRYPFSDT